MTSIDIDCYLKIYGNHSLKYSYDTLEELAIITSSCLCIKKGMKILLEPYFSNGLTLDLHSNNKVYTSTFTLNRMYYFYT